MLCSSDSCSDKNLTVSPSGRAVHKLSRCEGVFSGDGYWTKGMPMKIYHGFTSYAV